MSHGFERMKKDTMTDSNQTSQPTGSDREEVLKVYPDAYVSFIGQIYRPIYRNNSQYGEFLGESWADARSRLPNAPAPQTSIALHPSLTPEMPTGFAPEPVEKYVPEWVQRVDLATGPVDHTASAPAYDRPPDPVPQTAPEPVERELQRVESELSAKGLPPLVHPAPSEPEVPPLDYTDEELQREAEDNHPAWKMVGAHILCRERQLLATLRENQQLRKQLEASRHAGEVLMHTSNANFDRFKAAEQQLAQIRSVSVAMPPMEWHNGANYCMALDVAQKLTEAKQTIAALRLDNAQKGKRIAELEGGKK